MLSISNIDSLYLILLLYSEKQEICIQLLNSSKLFCMVIFIFLLNSDCEHMLVLL